MTAEAVTISVLSQHSCHLGEGATYDAASDTAWWFDILERTLLEHRFASGETVLHPLPFMASQLSFIDDRRQLVASDAGLYVREIATGKLALHTPLEADNAATRSNDGRVHPSGALWIGTMGRKAETGAGAIYHFRDGLVTMLFSAITIPNAICFAPDGATAYFTDTAAGLLMRVAVDPATGLSSGEPSALYDHRGQAGGLDGAVVDADGLIWNARWGGSCIDAYSPAGDRLRSIAVPARQPTCPLFVGAKADRLLLTSAREGMSEADVAADPDAGKTFVLDFPMAGRHQPRLRLG